MKRLIIFSFLFLSSCLSYEQSMESIFNLLPRESTPELNSEQKKILLKNKEYIIPNGDSLETVKYSLEIDETNQYLRYEYYFTTGQKGFNTYEIRKFKKKDGSSLIVFSSYGGAIKAFDQTELVTFEYKNKRLSKTKNNPLPGKINIDRFLKANTPDSIRKEVEIYSNRSFDLSPELKNEIGYRVSFEIINDEIEKYLLGDVILFPWTGKGFVPVELSI